LQAAYYRPLKILGRRDPPEFVVLQKNLTEYEIHEVKKDQHEERRKNEEFEYVREHSLLSGSSHYLSLQ